jgi:hypothetical protein
VRLLLTQVLKVDRPSAFAICSSFPVLLLAGGLWAFPSGTVAKPKDGPFGLTDSWDLHPTTIAEAHWDQSSPRLLQGKRSVPKGPTVFFADSEPFVGALALVWMVRYHLPTGSPSRQ